MLTNLIIYLCCSVSLCILFLLPCSILPLYFHHYYFFLSPEQIHKHLGSAPTLLAILVVQPCLISSARTQNTSNLISRRSSKPPQSLGLFPNIPFVRPSDQPSVQPPQTTTTITVNKMKPSSVLLVSCGSHRPPLLFSPLTLLFPIWPPFCIPNFLRTKRWSHFFFSRFHFLIFSFQLIFCNFYRIPRSFFTIFFSFFIILFLSHISLFLVHVYFYYNFTVSYSLIFSISISLLFSLHFINYNSIFLLLT